MGDGTIAGERVAKTIRARARARARAIAVGTAISGRPPHRSVRAELLHTAPTFDVDVRSVLQDTDGGYVGWGAIDCRSS